MVVANGDLLILPERAALDAANGHAADILVIVDGGDEHLERRVHVRLRRGDILENGIEQGLEIRPRHIRRVGCRAVAPRAEQHRGVELLGRGIEIHQKLEHLVHDLVDALVGAVDLVDDDDHAVPQLQRAGEDEARLRHGTLGGIDKEDDAVDHLQDTLYLAAEVGVARGIDDVDLGVAVADGGVLGKDGDAALALEIVRVHHAVHDLLIFAVHAALLEHFVNEGGLAVVNVGDDGDVAKLVVLHSISLLPAAGQGSLRFEKAQILNCNSIFCSRAVCKVFSKFFCLFCGKSAKGGGCAAETSQFTKNKALCFRRELCKVPKGPISAWRTAAHDGRL